MSFECVCVHSCEKAVGMVMESVGGEGCLPGGRLVGSRRPAQGQAGPGVGMLSRPFGRFAIVRVLHMHPTHYN